MKKSLWFSTYRICTAPLYGMAMSTDNTLTAVSGQMLQFSFKFTFENSSVSFSWVYDEWTTTYAYCSQNWNQQTAIWWPCQDNLLRRQETMGFLNGSSTGWTICKQSAHYSNDSSIIFTGWMLCQKPNQQNQITEGNGMLICWFINISFKPQRRIRCPLHHHV